MKQNVPGYGTIYDRPDEALEERLDNHALWLQTDGASGEQFRVEENEVFYGLNLFGVNLKKAILDGATFASCNMKRANLMRAYAPNTKWINTLLQDAKMNRMIKTNAKFIDCPLNKEDKTLYELPGDALEEKLNNHALWLKSGGARGNQFFAGENEVFEELNLFGIDLRIANLAGATFKKCNMNQANLLAAYAPDTIWIESLLQDVKAEGVILTNAKFDDCEFNITQFDSAANIDGALWSTDQILDAEERMEAETAATLQPHP